MEETKNKIDVFTALRPKLREYLLSKGIAIDDSGFLSCIHPNHPDHHPSCSIGGNTDEQVFHCFSCLPMTEKVRTPSGLKKMMDLKIGESIYSQYGIGKIVNIINRIPTEQIIEIQLQNVRNDNIQFTANHIFKVVKDMSNKVPYIKPRKDGNYDTRFFGQLKKRTRSKKYTGKIEISEYRADELKINDYLVFPKTQNNLNSVCTKIVNQWLKPYVSGPKNNRIEHYPINEDTMWLLGLYCAEGSSYRGGITFTLHRNEKEFQDRIKFIIKNNFNLDCSNYEYDYKHNTTNISCSSTDLQNFFEGFIGKHSSYKYISDDFICGLDVHLQRAWLEGLYDGDGGKKKPKRLTLVNENLISTAQQIMVNLEIPFSYSYKESYWGNDGIERKPTWSLIWLEKENIGCFYDTANDGHRYAFLRIDKIFKLDSKPEVYDITVEEPGTNSHTFMTKHYLVHNCGAAGNIIHAVHFLDKKPITGLGLYTETLPYLCKMFDIPYEPIEISEDQKREFQKRRAYEDAVNVVHSMIYKKQDKLRIIDQFHPAIKHLFERGITQETIKKFKIGCIPSHKEYMDEMKVLGWSDKSYLESADLANRKIFSSTGIIIPIFDDKGREVGFVTRRTDMEANAHGEEKYINSQNSDIYHKSEILFNYNNCRVEDGPLFIVEGYLDAVYMVQAGISNVAAIGATMLTEEHVDMLFTQKFRNIIVCLDSDEGGRRGIKLAIERLASYKGFKVRIMELPEGMDPDTFVREQGKDKFLDLARSDNSLSPFTWMLKWTTFEDDPMETAKKAIPTIAAEESNIVRLQMIKELSRLTAIAEQDIRKDVEALVNKESSKFLEELSDINNYVQVQLSRKKIRDTKSILEESILKVKSLEKQYNNSIDNGSQYNEQLDSVKDRIESGEFKYGLRAAKFKTYYESFDGIPYTTCLSLIGGRPSAGKCLAPGTKVWTNSGLKNVEDITTTDLLLGDDGTLRRVLSTTNGTDLMYRVSQTNAMDYVVNSQHILSLKRCRNGKAGKHGDIIDIPVNEFIKKPNKFKNNFKGYKVAIPTKIRRKQLELRSNKKNWGLSNITITFEGYGKYYGFEIDGNRRFLLEDGTVTHNTMWMTALAMDVINTEEDSAIFYMTIDDTTSLMTLKMLAMISGLSTSEIKRYTELSTEKKQKVDVAWAWIHANKDRFILADATAGNTIDALESHVDWFTKRFPNKKKLFLLDNFHKLRFPSLGRSKKTEAVSDGSERIKELTQLNDLHIMATTELRKLEGSTSRPQLADLKDSVQLEYDADIIVLVHNDKQVNESTMLVWDGPSKDGLIRSMPYVEVHVHKNKITGQQQHVSYELNDYNLSMREVPSSILRAKTANKTNGSNQMGVRRI